VVDLQAVVHDADAHALAGEVAVPGALHPGVAAGDDLVDQMPLAGLAGAGGVAVEVRVVGDEGPLLVLRLPVEVHLADAGVAQGAGVLLALGVPLVGRHEDVRVLVALELLLDPQPVVAGVLAGVAAGLEEHQDLVGVGLLALLALLDLRRGRRGGELGRGRRGRQGEQHGQGGRPGLHVCGSVGESRCFG
jgi:hypothetical protein